MKLKRITSGLLVAVLLGWQGTFVALADSHESSASEPAPTTTTQNSEPDPAPAPAPEPEPQPAPAPEPDPAPAPAPEPEPQPAPAPTTNSAPSDTQPSGSTTGEKTETETTGVIPRYAFNDATRKWEPTITSSFTWDKASGLWVSPFYTYDSKIGWYRVKPNVTPSKAITELTAGSGDPAATLAKILGASNSTTGSGSTNESAIEESNRFLAELVNNATVTNLQSQTALSGDATVSSNTTGGSAKTGAASVVTNLLNLLNAIWTWSSGGINHFVFDIFGNRVGDINLNTGTGSSGGGGSLGACDASTAGNTNTGPDSSNTANTSCSNDISVKTRSTGSITNNVDMLARSGDASVNSNTNGGDALSGDARAQINIINLINSAIGAGQTFFGMINIYGDLNGDILFPGLNLNGAVASSGPGPRLSNTDTGPNSVNTAELDANRDVAVENTNQALIDNNIQATAESGNATVSQNTNAGSATSGNATTNTSLFNLFGTHIFGENAVLVIVNNLGRWMGKIINFGGNDLGSSGLLTSNATVSNDQTGPDSLNTARTTDNSNVRVDNETQSAINNNVNVRAESGDADVSRNTNAGSAKSGDATVAANVANIVGSSLNFKNWFGILIINVFGNWFGSAGEDTEAGSAQAAQEPSKGVGGGQPVFPATVHSVVKGMMQVRDQEKSSNASVENREGSSGVLSETSGDDNLSRIADAEPQSTNSAAIPAPVLTAGEKEADNTATILLLIAAVCMLAAIGASLLERKLKN